MNNRSFISAQQPQPLGRFVLVTRLLMVLLLTALVGYGPGLHAQTVTQSWAALAAGAPPQALAIDASGTVYTANANTSSSTVSKITSAGVVTPSWAVLAAGAQPYGIAIDALGNVYTANAGNNTISKITSAGVVTQAWAALAAGAQPYALAIDDASGTVYTANYGKNTVSKITSAGVVTPSWAALAAGANPFAIVIDASGTVYTANSGTNTVSKITSAGVVTQAWAALATGAIPYGLAIDASGNVYTGNFGKSTVSKITSAGVVTPSWAALAAGAGPTALAIDASGTVYTANSGTNTVSKITSAGVVTQSWAALAAGALPIGIVKDASGNLYTANNGNNTVSKISAGCTPPAVSISPASQTITSGTSVTLTASGATSYTWSSGSTANPLIVTNVTSATAFSVTGVTGGCSASATAAVSVTAPLPVGLVAFTAQVQPNQTVLLQWSTAWETQNKGFRIERSKDLIAFESVGQVSEGAAGPTALTTYQLTDPTPFLGTSYYRLTQTDWSGKATSYPAVSVVIRQDAYGVFPNPVASGGSFMLRLDEPNTAILHFANELGKPLALERMGVQGGNLVLRPSGWLPGGLYLLTVEERGQRREYRLVVQ